MVVFQYGMAQIINRIDNLDYKWNGNLKILQDILKKVKKIPFGLINDRTKIYNPVAANFSVPMHKKIYFFWQ